MAFDLLSAPAATDQLEKPFYTDNPMELAEYLQVHAASGILPGLSNGWHFEFDRRPAEHENDYIPASVYTRYFAKQTIPVADVDHELHGHDIRHIPSYQNMFRLKALAQLAHSNQRILPLA
jgi:hypothetical protein